MNQTRIEARLYSLTQSLRMALEDQAVREARKRHNPGTPAYVRAYYASLGRSLKGVA